ncbi:uncharacterized protein B0P05DRAFT_642066 [Gilbertella persicaria]|uniref:uncharacterized protein n=1 Tax=Gilbertella persicaria TaxID=101096 RepID=UPI002220518D|nr:uncharacterized protein B0P05DRAFT_642066 [Gilbertella persicaria]KAI8048028.1 hypothetical protein B0P05DRAFT_642066 [Gilbertella persicaria]
MSKLALFRVNLASSDQITLPLSSLVHFCLSLAYCKRSALCLGFRACFFAVRHDLNFIRANASWKVDKETFLPELRNQHKQQEFVFNSHDILASTAKFRRQSLALLSNPKDGFISNINKLLAIHWITKLSTSIDAELGVCCDIGVLEALRCYFRLTISGKSLRLNSTITLDLKDIADDFKDDDEEKLRDSISGITKRVEGASRRTIQALSNLINKMTVKKKNIGEKKAEDILESVWSSVFKKNKHYDPHKFDNALSSFSHSLAACCPDYEVDEGANIINSICEVKSGCASPTRVSLDTFRLGLFSLGLVEEHNLA